MILKNINFLSDEEFEKITEKHNQVINDYLENITYDFVAFYIANGYNLSSICNSSLLSHINSALDNLSALSFKNNFDYNRLKSILRDKYKLKIVNEENLDIIEIK